MKTKTKMKKKTIKPFLSNKLTVEFIGQKNVVRLVKQEIKRLSQPYFDIVKGK
jgi:hypothetical protein